MGLMITHGCWEGSYSRFFEWRKSLWVLSGHKSEFGDREGPEGSIQGVWHEEPTDVLDVLLLHSGAEYSIPHRFCSALADRLEGLLEEFNSKNSSEFVDGIDFPAKTRQFITGLRFAASLEEDIEFH